MKSTLLLKPPFMMLQSSSILIVHETSQTTIFRGVNSWHLRLLLHPLELSAALLADLMPSLQFSGLGKAGSIVMGDPQLGSPYPHGLETPIKKGNNHGYKVETSQVIVFNPIKYCYIPSWPWLGQVVFVNLCIFSLHSTYCEWHQGSSSIQLLDVSACIVFVHM